nr:retrovirus-related Pol polyprotein from transposon TNT 1-94 [Tanacetum cinerariifolium]
MEIMDREVKRLKQSRIPIVKFVGTRGVGWSLHGNVRTSLGESKAVTPPDEEVMAVLRRRVKTGPLSGKRDVMATLNSKEIKERSKAKGDDGEGLYVRGRTDRRDSHQSRGKSRSKSRGGRLKCYIFQYKDHLKRNCLKNNRKKSTGKLNASVEEKDSLAQVWHKRLGHISEAGLQVLEKQGLFGKKSLGSDRLCSFKLIGSVSGGIIGMFKHEAFRKFKEWKQLVNNQTGRTVKKLRIDNEATCTATYLINRSPSRAIEKKTPMEIWSGHPSDYEMLRILGCVAYPYDKQGKLELRAIKCVLLGYSEGVKGYRPYKLDDESPKIVTRKNVIFNESVMYKVTLKDSFACDKYVEESRVEVELQRLNNHTPEEDQTYEEDGDDETYQEVVACKDSSKWKATMKEEMDSLRKNKTWDLVDHPTGHRDMNKVTRCVFLKKSLYGLKQSPRQSYRRFDEYMLINGFKRSSYDSCICYMSYVPGEYIYLLLYVDDMLIACKSKAEIGSTKTLLKKEFDMKELGEAKKILGIEIKSVKMPLGGHFKLSLKDYPVRDSDVERMSKVPYENAVGSLMYLMVCTRPDIAYAISLMYVTDRGNHVNVTGFVDSDYAKDPDKGLMYVTDRGNHVNVTGFVDSDYAKDPDKGRTMHINVRYHFIGEVLETKMVKVLKVDTEHNVADALRKVVPGLKLQHCLELLNVGIG